jgi:hypothetical protein
MRLRGWTGWLTAGLMAALICGAAVVGVWLSRYAVAVHRLTRGIGDTVFYGADGQPWFRLDEQRHDVSLAEISPDLQHAVVAVEDRRFYYHPGIDPIGLGRAVVRDVRGGARMEGGSTLTQQLARTIFLSNVKTFARKIKEAMLAIKLERVRIPPHHCVRTGLRRVTAGRHRRVSEVVHGPRPGENAIAPEGGTPRRRLWRSTCTASSATSGRFSSIARSASRTIERESSTSVNIAAARCFRAWNEPIGTPN